MDRAWSRLTAFARSRHGVLTWAEAIGLGIPPHRLQSWERSGRLVRVAPQVYMVAGVPETWRQRVRVATGSGAAWASHRTAAALWGINGFDGRIIEVVTPRGRRRKRRSWTVHESRTLRGVDLAVAGGIPATSVVRTILDLPAVAHPYLVGKALDYACRRDEHMLEAVTRRHRELPRRGRRGAVLMSEMLDERTGTEGSTDTDFETEALRLVRSIGLPEPVPQFRVRDGEFVAYLDLAWPDIMWLIECDSLDSHSGKGPHEWDRMRRRHLKRLGWDGVEITYDDVTKRAAKTGGELRELYDMRAAAAAAGHLRADPGARDIRRPSTATPPLTDARTPERTQPPQSGVPQQQHGR
jgi:predicted transcriptional regulator of viral defense system